MPTDPKLAALFERYNRYPPPGTDAAAYAEIRIRILQVAQTIDTLGDGGEDHEQALKALEICLTFASACISEIKS